MLISRSKAPFSLGVTHAKKAFADRVYAVYGYALIPRCDDDVVCKVFLRRKIEPRTCSCIDVSRSISRDVLADDDRTVDRGMTIHF